MSDEIDDETEIMVLMARMIAEDLCNCVEYKDVCMKILYGILTRGKGAERLYEELSDIDRIIIRERLKRNFGITWKT